MISHSVPSAYNGVLSFIARYFSRGLCLAEDTRTYGVTRLRPAAMSPGEKRVEVSGGAENAPTRTRLPVPAEETTGSDRLGALTIPVRAVRSNLSAKARRQRSALGTRGTKPAIAPQPKAKPRGGMLDVEVTRTELTPDDPTRDGVVPVVSSFQARSAAREPQGCGALPIRSAFRTDQAPSIGLDLHLPADLAHHAPATRLRAEKARPGASRLSGRGRAIATLIAVASLGASLFVCSALAQAPLSFSHHSAKRTIVGEGEVHRSWPIEGKSNSAGARSVPLAAGDVGGATIEPSGQLDSPKP